MLAIRLQRVGRKKLAQYRLIAQEHSVQPTSGKVAAYLGSYNPHTKEAKLDTEKIEFYLSNGAQPSNSAAKLLKNNKVKLPSWVVIATKEPKATKEPEAVEADATVEEISDEKVEAEAKPEETETEESKEPTSEPEPAETKDPQETDEAPSEEDASPVEETAETSEESEPKDA